MMFLWEAEKKLVRKASAVETEHTSSGLYFANTPSPWNSCNTSFSFLVESEEEASQHESSLRRFFF